MLTAQLLGNLGRDAETRTAPDGTNFVTFSVGCSGTKKDAPPTWVECMFSGTRAQKIAPYLKKGGKVFVYGNLALKSWQGRDGLAKTGLQVYVDRIEFAGSASGEARPAATAGEPGDPPPVRHHPGQQGLPGVPQPPKQDFADDDSVPF